MRLQPLLAVWAVSALLPLAANAGSFPAGTEQPYMTECMQTAHGRGVDATTAENLCKCGAKVIKEKFNDKEIKDLTTAEDGVDANLKQKAQMAVQATCKPK
ncbi:hypothetical protein P5705_08560 [Pseudomonas entomophila]|uniref:hypothetical protein n=1 Tax=Pseudomonas entomophila TaxID=312306 RepID=UPI002404B1C6|nr:hypothetical protein [Pseudomonas entomophila]MDF9617690.1 hypothetical protein [Pseudomonas entomophila]